MIKSLILVFIIAGSFNFKGLSQEISKSFYVSSFKKSYKTQDYLLPIKPERTISFVTDEGSYMNVDVSPDGKHILFDLLGDIYMMPSGGGTAVQMTRGIAVKSRPQWSPNGKYFAYFSDASGLVCLNIRDVPQKVNIIINTVHSPINMVPYFTWSPDGNGIVFNDSVYCVFKGKSLNLPVSYPLFGFSSKGKFSYYLSRCVDGKMAIRHNNFSGSSDTIFSTYREDLKNPKISPNGRWLVYIKGNNSHPTDSLVAFDLLHRKELPLAILHFRIVSSGCSKHLHYSFASDSKTIYIGFGGKIHKIDLESASVTNVSFKAKISVDAAPRKYHTYKMEDTLAIKYTRWAHRSPDGKQLVFSMINRIYNMDLPNGQPRLLVQQPFGQFQPAFSRDGKWIAYVSWEDKKGGQVWKVRSTGGIPEQITTIPGYYQNPSWSNDGSSVVVVKGEGEGMREVGQIQVISLLDGKIQIVNEKAPMLNLPIFSYDDKNIIYKPHFPENLSSKISGKKSVPQLVSTSLFNNQTTVLATGVTFHPNNSFNAQQLTQILTSPDGRYIVYMLKENLYLTPISGLTKPTMIYDETRQLPIIRIAHGGMDPHWEENGKMLSWSFGNKYCRILTDKLDALVEKVILNLKNAKRNIGQNRGFIDAPVQTDERITINVKLTRSYSKDVVALKNVRIVTMIGDSIIECGTIIVKNGRFTAVGNVETIKIPNEANVLELQGKTVIPGLIDLHSHIRLPGGDILLQQPWHFLANLAYGVTTARDPSGNYQLFAYNDLVESGYMKGPRIFGVGRAVRADDSIHNLFDANIVVQNHAKMGAIAIKQYLQPTRLHEQWVRLSSQKAGLNMTNEGGFTYSGVLGMIKNGSTGIEHHSPFGYEMYKDVEMLIAASKTFFCPTLQVANQGGEEGMYYFRDIYKKLNDTNRLKKFTPRNELDKIINGQRENQNNPPDVYVWAKQIAEIQKLGGKIVMGSHGEDQGIGAQFELWALQMGGLSNLEALRCATITGAEALGMQKDLGSIEFGKIADLIVLDKNPLEDIHNTLSINYVMKNGVVYDETLDKVWP